MEIFSLATFEPDNCEPPYLNTPRSLEACRLNGVSPKELAVISLESFEEKFPTDLDLAKLKYDRYEAARVRALDAVTKDWKILKEKKWKPVLSRPKSSIGKERILKNIPEEASCTLLELQAQKFRKIEMDQFNELNRMLKLQLKKAEQEIKHKKIVEKHNEISASNDQVKKELKLNREAIEKELIEKQKKLELDAQNELKRLREYDLELTKEKQKREAEKRLNDKLARERREAERVQRQMYTKEMKNKIISSLEDNIQAKKKIQ
eukprot:gene12120-16227_t